MAVAWMRMVKSRFAVLGSGMRLALRDVCKANLAAGRHERHALLTASKSAGGYR
jgi:hypothetical protein